MLPIISLRIIYSRWVVSEPQLRFLIVLRKHLLNFSAITMQIGNYFVLSLNTTNCQTYFTIFLHFSLGFRRVGEFSRNQCASVFIGVHSFQAFLVSCRPYTYRYLYVLSAAGVLFLLVLLWRPCCSFPIDAETCCCWRSFC